MRLGEGGSWPRQLGKQGQHQNWNQYPLCSGPSPGPGCPRYREGHSHPIQTPSLYPIQTPFWTQPHPGLASKEVPGKELRLEFPQETALTSALGPDNPGGSHPHPAGTGLCTEPVVSALKAQKLQTGWTWLWPLPSWTGPHYRPQFPHL